MGLEEQAVEAFNAFATAKNTGDVPAILLVGEGHSALARAAKFDGRHIMLRMPLKVRQLRSALVQLLKASATA